MYSKNRISSRPQGDASDRSFKSKPSISPRTRGFSSTPSTASSTTRIVRQTRPYVSPTKPAFSRGGFSAAPRPSRDYAPRGGNDFGGQRGGGFDRPAFRPGRPSFGGPARGGFGGGRSGGGFGGGRGRGPARGERIDHSKFIYKPDVATLEKEAKAKTKKVSVEHTFADFKFADQVQANLKEKGYENPTPIQDQTIMYALKGQDVLGLANTGSGKTAAFLLPLIDKVLKDPTQKVIILAPTRELAMQINKEFEEFSKGMKIFSTVCVGGMPIFRQIQNLRMVNHFIIGTPGRIKDLAHRRCIVYSQFNNVVLDEVDHMLDMGFVDDITEILKGLNPVRQSLFFSATMPPKIRALVQTFQKEPHVVDIAVPGSTKTVEQDIIKVRREDKFKTLCDLLKSEGATRTIIFVETKREVEEVAHGLEKAGFKTGFLHGDKRQRERARTLDQFKTGISDVLVATDVAARGIDVKDVSHVINYTVPQTHDDYVHRIGRAGRAGRTGKAFTFV
ncbi:MAG: DEAD/DEAH box helicase [Patescibacteria group bacterium]